MSSEVKSGAWKRLGLIAGGGDLPVRIAEAERLAGREPFVVRITDDTERLLSFPNERAGVAEIGGIMRMLKASDCDAVCFAGQVKRPNFSSLKPDLRGAALLPKAIRAARRGDGAIIDVIVQAFEDAGFLVVAAEAAAGSLLVARGALGSIEPSQNHFEDIRKASQIVDALGPFDVGQGAVVRSGFVLAVEAAEGTDAMLERCAALPSQLKGFEPGKEEVRLGVLVKQPKPGQELRVDLPTVGVQTVKKVAAAGLAGIGVAAERALVLDRDAVVAAADEAGIFVYGFELTETATP